MSISYKRSINLFCEEAAKIEKIATVSNVYGAIGSASPVSATTSNSFDKATDAIAAAANTNSTIFTTSTAQLVSIPNTRGHIYIQNLCSGAAIAICYVLTRLGNFFFAAQFFTTPNHGFGETTLHAGTTCTSSLPNRAAPTQMDTGSTRTTWP